VLLGFCLTTLFAFATNWARMRVENQLVEDVMNRNINEYARRFYEPDRNPDLPVQQMRARLSSRTSSTRCARKSRSGPRCRWHPQHQRRRTRQPYAYKLAVRKTPDAWFFLAYDMTDSVRGGSSSTARWCCRCWCSACCRWCWAGGRRRR
jgi:hypothetical protein